MSHRITAKALDSFLYLSLGVLALLVVILAGENRELKAELNPEVPSLEEGEIAAALVAEDLDGVVRELSWQGDSKDSLLFVFTTTCSACRETQASWRKLAEEAGPRVEVLGISLDPAAPTAAYRQTNSLPFPVLLPKDLEGFTDSYKVSVVPTTILLGPGGNVRGTWTGTLSKDAVEELKRKVGKRERSA